MAADNPMTPAEVARLADVTAATVKRYDHELRPERTSTGRRVYRRSVVEAWVEARKRAAAFASDYMPLAATEKP
jgi:DNA-binding transcriptional MerR regulator